MSTLINEGVGYGPAAVGSAKHAVADCLACASMSTLCQPHGAAHCADERAGWGKILVLLAISGASGDSEGGVDAVREEIQAGRCNRLVLGLRWRKSGAGCDSNYI